VFIDIKTKCFIKKPKEKGKPAKLTKQTKQVKHSNGKYFQ